MDMMQTLVCCDFYYIFNFPLFIIFLVSAWHANSYRDLRALDPHAHIITTSYAYYPGEPLTWATVDFTQV